MINTQQKENTKCGITKLNRKISVAPMMGWTDRHDRYFLRLIAPNILLYTVMITTGALLYGDTRCFLKFSPEEQPVALQLGGSSPIDLAKSAKLGEDAGYNEINLNCGCPSDRVQRGDFGVCLMKNAKLVAECVDAMKQSVNIPVTVKNRIGVDEFDSYDFLCDFIGTVSDKGGCDTFIIHARKAWLNGLSPKDNRTVPPLKWDIVHKIKQDFPHLTIILNGGIKTIQEIQENLPSVDGVMIGREAYHNPYFLSEIEANIFNTENLLTRHEVIDALIPYIEKELKAGIHFKKISRHILGLFQGIRGAKHWRRTLSDEGCKRNAGIDVINQALSEI